MSNLSSTDAAQIDNTTHRINILSLDQYPVYQLALNIWKIVPPCILLLGGFGNIATIFVMRGIKDHNSSQHAILMALAVADLTFLVSATMDEWLKYGFGLNVRIMHTAACKLLSWLMYVSGTMSAWLVTCVTVQRTMAVLWPHRMQVMCTVRRTWVVIAILVFSACGPYFHMLIGMDISEESRCQTIPGNYRHFYVVIFSWFHLCIASIFPSISLFICDIILSVALFKAVSSVNISAHTDSTTSAAAGKTDTRKKMSYRTTVMVLAISCAFLVLTLPHCVYRIWVSYIFKIIQRHPLAIPFVNLMFVITYQLWCLNSAINFYLYCLTGTKFRKEFMTWITCSARSVLAPAVHETAASQGGRFKHHGESALSK